MLKLITDEGTFEYTDINECIGEWLSDSIDMDLPSNDAIVQFVIKDNTTKCTIYIMDINFETYIESQIKMRE